jgi:hypothetical protein
MYTIRILICQLNWFSVLQKWIKHLRHYFMTSQCHWKSPQKTQRCHHISKEFELLEAHRRNTSIIPHHWVACASSIVIDLCCRYFWMKHPYYISLSFLRQAVFITSFRGTCWISSIYGSLCPTSHEKWSMSIRYSFFPHRHIKSISRWQSWHQRLDTMPQGATLSIVSSMHETSDLCETCLALFD